jgi:hypothetical protein
METFTSRGGAMPSKVLDRTELAKLFPQRGVGAEIGVFDGQHAISLHDNAKPRLLYLVDRWTLNSREDWPFGTDWDHVLSEAKSRFKNGERVEFVVSDSVAWMQSMPTASLDWIYLDANHDYESVSAEIHEAMRIVKFGGVIAGHDYTENPIDDNGNPYPCGVVQAVAEVIETGCGELTVTCERVPSWAIKLKANPDCQCELAGYCERHKVRKANRLIELCKQRGAYWEAWEVGKGPGQNSPAMRKEPKQEPPYNHWAPLHNYAAKYCHDWDRMRAKRWYRNWVAAIPNTRGCGCRAKWIEMKIEFDFTSPQAFFESSVLGHNIVNEMLGKPTITIEDARKIWSTANAE